MSAFENNLIERLRARSVDVQPQNQLEEGSIALAADVAGLDSSDFAFVISPTEMATLKLKLRNMRNLADRPDRCRHAQRPGGKPLGT
jgi:hypothetical protein